MEPEEERFQYICCAFITITNTVECYLVVVCFTVGQALALVVTVSQEGFLTLSTHKMLQTNPQPSALVSTSLRSVTLS